jgi:lipopolysaccharide/colanic/teichoic acid biosynthesis glycosyltransferase
VIARAFMRLIALVGLIRSAPLLAVISVAIKLGSRGPVLFVQDRIGLFGRPFRLLKFRTMVPDPCATSEWACDNSARITRVGKWLRKFRRDEPPQFINILGGEMALIGPRRHPISDHALFAEWIPHYAQKRRFDLYYIKHLSLLLDLRILFDTAKTVMFGRGANTADVFRGDDAAAEARVGT